MNQASRQMWSVHFCWPFWSYPNCEKAQPGSTSHRAWVSSHQKPTHEQTCRRGWTQIFSRHWRRKDDWHSREVPVPTGLTGFHSWWDPGTLYPNCCKCFMPRTRNSDDEKRQAICDDQLGRPRAVPLRTWSWRRLGHITFQVAICQNNGSRVPNARGWGYSRNGHSWAIYGLLSNQGVSSPWAIEPPVMNWLWWQTVRVCEERGGSSKAETGLWRTLAEAGENPVPGGNPSKRMSMMEWIVSP